jgi:hypothetical protein
MLKNNISSVFLWITLTFLLPVRAFGEPENPALAESPGGVKSLEQRIDHLNKLIERSVDNDNWYNRIQIGGLVEVEAGYENIQFNDPAVEGEKTGDVDAAAVEVDIDVTITDHVDGHMLIKHEEDDVFLDEGFIVISGGDDLPVFLVAGRQYLPFGNFDSHFITDPTTLTLGETNEGALVAGYRFGDDLADLALGAFKGKVRKSGDDDTIDGYVASLTATPFEGLAFGASYTSSLAAADALADEVTDTENLASHMAGFSAHASLAFLDRFKVMGEYVGALERFGTGEMYDPADDKRRRPMAWNAELAFAATDVVEIAARYGGSEDGADLLPESQYGAVINWGFFDSTNLALEYLYGKFEDDHGKTHTVTAQLAVEF